MNSLNPSIIFEQGHSFDWLIVVLIVIVVVILGLLCTPVINKYPKLKVVVEKSYGHIKKLAESFISDYTRSKSVTMVASAGMDIIPDLINAAF